MDIQQLETILSQSTNVDLSQSFRILHGRGRCYVGYEHVSVDWFDPIILITLYKYVEDFEPTVLADFFRTHFEQYFRGKTLKAIVLHNRSNKQHQVEVLWGDMPDNVYAREGKLQFQLDLTNRQNIGYFLDARNARDYLCQHVSGKKVLNLFSYTCAFSVSALAAGATSVINLDMGKGVLERGKINHQLNGIDMRTAYFIKSDIFKAWKKLHKYGRYDWIIIDPPSFQTGSFNAEKDYKKVVEKLGKLLASSANILACLNSPFLGEQFLDELFLNGPLNVGEHRCEKLKRLKNPDAFKDIDNDAGLKVIVYQYQRM